MKKLQPSYIPESEKLAMIESLLELGDGQEVMKV